MDNRVKHLELIQGVINRMAQSSFLLKGWSVVLVAALFALAAGDSRIEFIYLAYFPAAMFWFLDGYFLWQERLYRKLYDKVRVLEDSAVDFSMDTSSLTAEVDTWSRVIFSKTLLLYHATIVGTIVVVVLLVLFI